MSLNYSSRVEVDPDREWRDSCRRDLDQLTRSVAGMERNMAAVEMRLNNSFSGLSEGLEALDDADGKLSASIYKLAQRGAELGEVLHRTASSCNELHQLSATSLKSGAEFNAEVKDRIDASGEAIAAIEKQLYEDMAGAVGISNDIRELFGIAEAILRSMDVARKEGDKQNARTDAAYDAVNLMMNRLTEASAEWDEAFSSMVKEYSKTDNLLSSLSMTINSMENTRMATYLILQAISDEEFKLVEYMHSENGVDARLTDAENRHIFLSLSKVKDDTDELLLGLDLSNFDKHGDRAQCQRAGQILQQKLASIARLGKSEIIYPNRKGSDGAVVSVKARTGNRNGVSSSAQSRKEKV